MREKMMNKDYAKAFKTIVIMAVLLALLSAVVIPLSLSQQISDLSSLRQTSQEQTAVSYTHLTLPTNREV